MSATVALTREHLERAYAQVARPGWPTLDQLEQAHARLMIVRGRAVGIATGHPVPTEPVAAPMAAPATTPSRAAPLRRRDDAPLREVPYSTRMAAAGDDQ